MATLLSFMNADLQQSVLAAKLQAKTLLCLATDQSDSSSEWEALISEPRYREYLIDQCVTLKIHAGSPEAGFLHEVCPLDSFPALVSIKRGHIEHNFQHANVTTTELRSKLDTLLSKTKEGQGIVLNVLPESTFPNPHLYITLPPSAGRMRLSDNAYDAFGVQTQRWLDQGIRGDNVLRLQLKLLRNIPALSGVVSSIENRDSHATPELPAECQDQLLNTPSAALKFGQAPAGVVSSTTQAVSSRPMQSVKARQDQEAERRSFVRARRERGAADRAERERVKAQIALDRVERRRVDALRRETEETARRAAMAQFNSTTDKPRKNDIRVQVRTLDGNTIKATFAHDSSIIADIRPWIGAQLKQDTPYELKLILTPSNVKTIEIGEEEQSLSELEFARSATLVMVPIESPVDAYTAAKTGIVSAVTSVVAGVTWFLGWDRRKTARRMPAPKTKPQTINRVQHQPRSNIHTLSDHQTGTEKKQGTEVYNGNQLNFSGRKLGAAHQYD